MDRILKVFSWSDGLGYCDVFMSKVFYYYGVLFKSIMLLVKMNELFGKLGVLMDYLVEGIIFLVVLCYRF